MYLPWQAVQQREQALTAQCEALQTSCTAQAREKLYDEASTAMPCVDIVWSQWFMLEALRRR